MTSSNGEHEQRRAERWPAGAGPPVHWPSLGADEAAYEWEDLRQWVQRYRQRYPIPVVVPECWFRHSNFVELLTALRDHERASYGRAAPGTAAMEWHHARHQAEVQLDLWRRRLPCDRANRADPASPIDDGHTDWEAHVREDLWRRGR